MGTWQLPVFVGTFVGLFDLVLSCGFEQIKQPQKNKAEKDGHCCLLQ